MTRWGFGEPQDRFMVRRIGDRVGPYRGHVYLLHIGPLDLHVRTAAFHAVRRRTLSWGRRR